MNITDSNWPGMGINDSDEKNVIIIMQCKSIINPWHACAARVTSVLAKVLETLTLMWMQCHFSERKTPHLNQIAYRKGVSCAEAIFSTMEVISTYSQCSEKVYMCFYDLQNAFDSIQYPVLLKRLYEFGVNGKAWRLLRSRYISPNSMVRVNGLLSSPLTLECGVLQGSILSPVLFLLMMDPLLKSLQNKGLCLSCRWHIWRRFHPCWWHTHYQQLSGYSTRAD